MTKGSREINGQWLKEEFERLGVSAVEVGKTIGCDSKKFYNHINNETKLQAGVLAAIWFAYPKFDMHYVLVGRHIDSPNNQAITELDKASDAIAAAKKLL